MTKDRYGNWIFTLPSKREIHLRDLSDSDIEFLKRAVEPQPQQSVEPVAWMHMKYGHIQKNGDGFPSHLYSSSEQWTPLFTAPPNTAEIQAKAIEAAAEVCTDAYWTNDGFGITGADRRCHDLLRELAEKVLRGEVTL